MVLEIAALPSGLLDIMSLSLCAGVCNISVRVGQSSGRASCFDTMTKHPQNLLLRPLWRWFQSAFIAFLAVLAGGCVSTTESAMKLPAVGPVPGIYGNYGTRSGYLQVFSATRPVNDGGVLYYPHTAYSIYSAEGKRVTSCPNHAGPDDQTPLVVPLIPGRYTVYALADGLGMVAVPTVITRGQLTIIFLGRDGMPKKDLPLLLGRPLVSTAEGRIIGCQP